jgi:hypothetical protein
MPGEEPTLGTASAKGKGEPPQILRMHACLSEAALKLE